MGVKKLIRFYFSAGSLERALDTVTQKIAISSAYSEAGCEYFAERILGVIALKQDLSVLWGRLDAVISGMSARDTATLKRYGSLRTGVKKLPAEERKEIHRAVMKFTRRAEGLRRRCGELYKTLCSCYCLLSSEAD